MPSLTANLWQSARNFPGRPVITEGERTIAFDEFARTALAVAQYLRTNGLLPGERVALILPNSIEFAAACYGVMAAGGVAVLLNVAGKAREIAAWLRDSQPTWVLTERANGEALMAAQSLPATPRLLFAEGAASGAFGLPPAQSVDLDDLRVSDERNLQQNPACILYTSGTTGAPKGVVLSHENLSANTRAITEYLQLTEHDSIVNVLPFYYAYGSSVLHSHVRAGAHVVIEKNLVYPHAVVETLVKTRATGFAGVPSTFALLLSRVKLENFDLSGLRYVTQAGGAMSPALTERLRAALPRADIIVMYGLTEATARLTYLPPAQLTDKLGSVGIAIPGVRLEIRSEQGAVLPPNEAGEVWVQGPNIMLGYWGNDAATAEVKHEGWLKTGDTGSLDADGFLFIAGRRSDMIKVGANRVHPQEIEDTIAELPQVQEAAVIGVEDENLGQAIKAYVVLTAPASLAPMQVQAHCRERLANYKVPKSVVFVASLPKTANGKIRRLDLHERSKI